MSTDISTEEQELLWKRLEEIRQMSAPVRRKMIKEAFDECATSADGTADYVPLFEREGLSNSDVLRTLATNIGTEYVDMLLVQRSTNLNPSEHINPEFLDTETTKELAVWNEYAVQQLKEHHELVDQYRKSHGSSLLGSIINLARTHVVEKLTGFQVDSIVDPDDLEVPHRKDLNWVLREHYPGLGYIVEPRERTAVVSSITGGVVVSNERE